MKILKIIILFILPLSLVSCNSNENCSLFQKGKFIYFNKDRNRFNKNQIALRTTNEQIYIDSKKGDTLIYNLKWISDCEYELVFKRSNTKIEGLAQIGDTIQVTMEPINNLSYKYVSIIKKNGHKSVFEGKMKKIE